MSMMNRSRSVTVAALVAATALAACLVVRAVPCAAQEPRPGEDSRLMFELMGIGWGGTGWYEWRFSSVSAGIGVGAIYNPVGGGFDGCVALRAGLR
jgi:hypothetical protein